MKDKILITALSFQRSPESLAFLKNSGYEVFLSSNNCPMSEADLIPLMKDVSAIVAGNDDITERVIAAGLPKLKIIAKCGAGYNNIDVAAAKRLGVVVTSTPGANSKSVADLTLGLMLSLARNIPQMDDCVHSGGWKKSIGHELGGKTLGLVGTGNIGGEVIRRARAFDMNVMAYSIPERRDLIEAYGVVYLPLPEVIAQADFLSLHVPATPQTIGMINKATLRTMKSTACLINTARGELVVEEDLYQALEQGIIAGAALDAFTKEPLGDSPLRKLSNVILTPHIGAGTLEASQRVGKMAAQEVIRVLTVEEPSYPVK